MSKSQRALRRTGKRENMLMDFDKRELREFILRDKYNKVVFRECKALPLYLVGGYLRDVLMRRDCRDRDYVAGGDYNSLLERLVTITGGKLVKLGDYLSRVVLRDSSTLDFSPLAGDIANDLSMRDFSINSLAWSPHSGILDPHRGLQDLRKKTIRMISKENLEHDPVRIIRAYRFAGELSFRIDPGTIRVIKEMSETIIHAKSERITLEFFKILNLDASSKVLGTMVDDGLLKRLIPFHDKELRVRLRALSRVNRIFNVLPLKYKRILQERYSQNLLRKGLIRLEVLLKGMPPNVLTLSSRIARSLEVLERGEKSLLGKRWSRGAIFDAFSLMGDASVDFLILHERTQYLSEYESFLDIMKKGLLSSVDIIKRTGITEGASLGRAIRMVKKAQFTNKIATAEGGVKLLLDNLTKL